MTEMEENVAYSSSQRERFRKQSKEDFWFFTNETLCVSSWLRRDIHKPMCDFLQGDATVKDLCGFRGCLKTTLLSAYLVWMSIRNPNISILLVSKVDKNAASTLRLTKTYWQTNKKLRMLFPELIPDTTSRNAKWSDFAATINRPDARRDPTYAACGLGSTITSQHYNVIILDDAISAEKDKITGEDAAPSLQQIEQAIGFWKMCNNLLVDIAGFEAQRVNVGTRWAINDLSAWIRNNEVDVTTYDFPVQDAKGVPTFPVKGDGSRGWDRKKIDTFKQRMGVYMFAGQFDLDPFPKEKMVFHPEWVQDKYFTHDDIAGLVMNYYICVDPAISIRKHADFTGIVVVGVSSDDHRWICEAEQLKIEDPFAVAKRVCALAKTYSEKPTTRSLVLVVETDAYQKALKFVVERELRDQRMFIPVRQYRAGSIGKKTTRILGLEPIASDGRLHIRRGLTAFENQMFTWIPEKTKHEHLLDAAAQHIQFAYAPRVSVAPAIHPSKLDPFDMDRIRWETKRLAYAEQEATWQQGDEAWKPPTPSLMELVG